MNNEQSIEQLENNMREAQRLITLSDALHKLESIKEFKEVIMQDYLRNESIRLVHAKADPSTQDPEIQADIIKQMDSIGSLISYFRKVHIQANQARKSMSINQEEREELLKEGSIDG